MADEIHTEQIRRKAQGIAVQIGNNRWTVPTLTVIAAVLGALGTAYRVVEGERAQVWEAINRVEKQQQATDAKLAIEAVTLTNIQVQLARIDARVAEVQVTLMRGGR